MNRKPFFRIQMTLLLLSVIIGQNIFAQSTDNAVWQWSVGVDGHLDNNTDSRAFLWIPPDCGKVRGVIVAQNNMEESSILENPAFRKAMSDKGFAEIWISPFFDHLFRFNEGAGEIFNKMMNNLADSSGYEELKYAPIVTLGHSAAASWPYYFAAWNPGRTLAVLSVSGQWPYFRNPVFAPDIWSKKQNIDSIPSLETMGEYENAESWATEGLKQRQEHPLMPLSMLACPAEGHFATTDEKVAYLALYIKKAAEYRLPHIYPENGVPQLRPINPGKTGWLVPRWRRNAAPAVQAAPVAEYKGDPAQAFWFFDEEMAKATLAYEAAHRGKQAQAIEYVQAGKGVDQHENHEQVDLKFLPEADGITFKLNAQFTDTVPGGSRFPSDWTQLPVGTPIKHSQNGLPVEIERISGPFIKNSFGTFAVHFTRGMRAVKNNYELWFIASHNGDEIFKPAILQAKMVIPSMNTEGKIQHIRFDTIANQKQGVTSFVLRAKSDAGLPVQFYVQQGPVKLQGNTLLFTKIPPRSRFPLKVTIVVWQYGTSIEPKIQSAVPVSRSFFIYK